MNISPRPCSEVIPHQGLTGLSSANYHEKIVLGKVPPIPQRGSSNLPTKIINGIPSGVIVKISAKYLFPQSNSPQSNLFNKFIPQWSHLLLQVYSHSHLCSPSPAKVEEPQSSITARNAILSSSSQGFIFPDSDMS